MKKTTARQKFVKPRAPSRDPIELEIRELELEQLRDEVKRARSSREFREQQLKNQEETLRKGREDERRIQRQCKHRKGGRDKQGVVNMLAGTDENYSVVTHTYPNMMTVVFCQRCQMEWHPGDTAEKLMPRYPGDPGQKNHTRISYETALEWPTDNEPSGASLFLIPVQDSALLTQIASLQTQLAALQGRAAGQLAGT